MLTYQRLITLTLFILLITALLIAMTVITNLDCRLSGGQPLSTPAGYTCLPFSGAK